jgi:hypothetical protein
LSDETVPLGVAEKIRNIVRHFLILLQYYVSTVHSVSENFSPVQAGPGISLAFLFLDLVATVYTKSDKKKTIIGSSCNHAFSMLL